MDKLLIFSVLCSFSMKVKLSTFFFKATFVIIYLIGDWGKEVPKTNRKTLSLLSVWFGRYTPPLLYRQILPPRSFLAATSWSTWRRLNFTTSPSSPPPGFQDGGPEVVVHRDSDMSSLDKHHRGLLDGLPHRGGEGKKENPRGVPRQPVQQGHHLLHSVNSHGREAG